MNLSRKMLVRLLVAAVLLALFTWAVKHPDLIKTVKTAPKHPSPAKKWELTLSKGARTTPAIADDGTIYVGTPGGLHAVSPDGQVLWVFTDAIQPGSSATSSNRRNPYRAVNAGTPTIGPDGRIYVVSMSGTLYAIERDGSMRWKIATGGFTGGAPVVVDSYGFLYINAQSGLQARRTLDGEVAWEAESRVSGTPILTSNNEIVVGGSRGVAVVRPGGTTFAEYGPTSSWSSCNEPVLGADSTLYTTCGEYKFHAYTLSGQHRYEFKNEGGTSETAAVIAADGTIYLASRNKLHALTPELTEKWTYDFYGSGLHTPALAEDGTIYLVGQSQTRVLALTPEGKVRWEFMTNGQIQGSPALAPDGTIYIVTSEGTLYAIEGGGGGLMESAWPKYRRDNRNSGAQ